ncbi:hypothetical protein ALDI51_19110 [Alicycliphilus denitrificans]|nr:hypothetical protein ALDI51_19110 [Alicycliphilus denitrificans]
MGGDVGVKRTSFFGSPLSVTERPPVWKLPISATATGAMGAPAQPSNATRLAAVAADFMDLFIFVSFRCFLCLIIRRARAVTPRPSPRSR